jgi:hypothetical protein
MHLFRKKEVYVPTWTGWGFFAFSALALLFFVWLGLYPFLAVNRPQAGTEVILVEGWLPDTVLEQVLLDYRPDQFIVTTGVPVTFGAQLLGIETYAEISTARLIKAGIDEGRIITAPAEDVMRDRTYASAVAARAKMEEAGLFGRPVTIYSGCVHSRRTLLLYRRAFGRDYPLGIVALDSEEYEAEKWWRYSSGFKQVLMEAVSWLYTRLTLFTYD